MVVWEHQKLKELHWNTEWLRTLNNLLSESLLPIQCVGSQLKTLPQLKTEHDSKMVISYKHVSIWKEVVVAYVKLIFAYQHAEMPSNRNKQLFKVGWQTILVRLISVKSYGAASAPTCLVNWRKRFLFIICTNKCTYIYITILYHKRSYMFRCFRTIFRELWYCVIDIKH
jgi:hypothetical protein